MPERIENLISKEALAQFERLNELTDANVASFERLIAKGVEINKTLAGASALKDINQATKELTENEKKLVKVNSDLEIAQQKLNNLVKEAVRTTVELKKQQNETTSASNQAAAATQKQSLTIEQNISRLVELTNKLKENREQQKEISKSKDLFAGLNQDLPSVQKGIEEVAESERRLVLEEKNLRVSISEANKEIREAIQLNETNNGSINQAKAAIKSLIAERNNLDLTTEEGIRRQRELNEEIDRYNLFITANVDKQTKQSRNVGNYSGAVKVLEKALEDVNRKLDDFNKSGTGNSDVVAELTKEQALLTQLLEGQTAGFASLTTEIKANELALIKLKQAGLEDSEAYRELFNEIARTKDELASFKKELATTGQSEVFLRGAIQAAQTLAGLYGVAQGAAALFGDENEELQKTFVKLQAVLAILNGLEALNNALKKENALRTSIRLGLQKVEIVQTNLQTAAESKNIIVRYAAIAAQKALNAVMSAAGGPILAIIGVIALLVISLSAFASGADKAAKSMQELNDQFETTSKLNNENADAIKKANEIAVAELNNRFASESEIRLKIFNGLKQELKERQDFNQKNQVLYDQADDTIRKYIGAQEVYYTRNGEIRKRAKKLSDAEQKELDAAIAIRDRFNDNQDKQFELEHQIRLKSLEFQRQNAIDVANLNKRELEIQKLTLTERAIVQAQLLGDETRSYQERIEAATRFQELQIRIAQAQARIERSTPGLSPSEIAIIEKNKQVAINNAIRQGNETRSRLQTEYAKREAQAQFEIARIAIETQSKAAQQLADDQNKNLEDRLFAAYEFQQAQEALIIGQRNLELTNSKLIASERKAIEDKANAEIIASKLAFNEKVKEITLSELDEENRLRIAANDKQRDESIKALNDRFNAGKISLSEYNRERLNLEKGYAIESLEIEIGNVQKVIDEYKKQGKEVGEEEARLAALQKDLSDEVTNKKIDDLNKLHDLQKQLAAEAFETITSLFNADIDNQKNAIQDQIDALDKKKEKDIEVANNSIQNEQDKAAAIQTINLRAQAEKEALERRQRQLDTQRARFEKAANIASIITNTASAIVKALPNIPLSVTIGIIGALQLARAVATSIPRFAEGTKDAPGGLSLVGDAYKKEYVLTPDNNLYETPATPTVMNVPKHSIVFPDERSVLESGLAVNRDGNLVENNRDIQNMTNVLGGKIDRLNNTIKSKQEVHIKAGVPARDIIFSKGGNNVKYLNDNINR